MRRQLTILCVLVACAGDDPDSASLRCEQGLQQASEAVDALVAASPACSRDAECTIVDTTIDCAGLRIGSCGTVVHRDVAGTWDADLVCAQIERLSDDPPYSCQVSPVCVSVQAACIDGSCAARP